VTLLRATSRGDEERGPWRQADYYDIATGRHVAVVTWANDIYDGEWVQVSITHEDLEGLDIIGLDGEQQDAAREAVRGLDEIAVPTEREPWPWETPRRTDEEKIAMIVAKTDD
jgi:hypothetical protein